MTKSLAHTYEGEAPESMVLSLIELYEFIPWCADIKATCINGHTTRVEVA